MLSADWILFIAIKCYSLVLLFYTSQVLLKVCVNMTLRSLALPLHFPLCFTLRPPPALLFARCAADTSNGVKRGKTLSHPAVRTTRDVNWSQNTHPPVVD